MIPSIPLGRGEQAKGNDTVFCYKNTPEAPPAADPNEKPINHVVFNEPSCFYARLWEYRRGSVISLRAQPA